MQYVPSGRITRGMESEHQSEVGVPASQVAHEPPSVSEGIEGRSGSRRSGRRKRLACRRCQARKIKCDGLSPKCSGCQRARTECVDGKTTWQDPAISKREAIRLQQQNKQLLEVLRERLPDVYMAHLDGDGQSTTNHPSDSPQLGSHLPQRTPAAAPMTISHSPDATRTTHLPNTPDTSATPHTDRPSDIAHELGMIPLSAGINKYVGPSSGFSIAKLVLARADQASGYTPGSNQSDETAETRCRSMFTISPSALPASKQEAAQLSRIYFEQVHPRYPFLHEHSHFHSLEEVYEDSRSATKAVEFQVTMVLAISATILSRRLRIPFSGEGLCAAAMQHADGIDFQSSTEGVQCLLLISMFTLHSPFLGINPWYLNYQCLAAILDLGLQQDLSVGHPIDAFEREMRTRVFWVVFSIDRIIATTLGRPVGLRDEACDLRLPEGFEDPELETLRTQSQGEQSSSPPRKPAAISCALVHFKLSLLNSEIIHTLHSISPNAPQQTYLRVLDVNAWQSELFTRLEKIRQDLPTFGRESRHLLALCEIRYHEIVMLLFRPTPRVRTPSKESLTRCFESAEATIRLWKELYHSDRMSYSWTSIHSICLSAVIILYCIWMVQDLTISTEIDSLTQTMVAASNLLSAAGEHWADARRCRDSLNNLTTATVRWLVNLRSKHRDARGNCRDDENSLPQPMSAEGMMTDNYSGQHQQGLGENGDRIEGQALNPEIPWVDSYINGDDLASLFRTSNPFSADPPLTMEGMFVDYQPLFEFYQDNYEFSM